MFERSVMQGLRACMRAALCAILSCVTPFAFAADPSPQQAEVQAAIEAARNAAQDGPRDVPLGQQAVLKLPEGFAYIPVAEARRFMTAMGNPTGDDFLGLVVGEGLNGFVSVRFEASGYVKDDDARSWDAAELLKNLQEGTEAGNEERRRRGIPEFVVSGWVEKPAYDAATHRLVWSASLRNKQQQPGEDQGVNYNTYVLGREGYLSLNLVTDMGAVEAEKPLARDLLAAVSFNDGKRYADFDASTDKVAEYGLAALVGGIAAKKLGLLAAIGVALAKFWKLIAIAAIALGAGARKYLGRKNAQTDNQAQTDSQA